MPNEGSLRDSYNFVSQSVIELIDVKKSYGHHQVLKGINLSIKKGESVVLCGSSGSGKSTLLRLINRMEAITEGEILVAGTSINQLRGGALLKFRTSIGFVFQHFNLYAHLDAKTNITLALRKVLKLSSSESNARADTLLARLGLEGKGHHFPSQLSGGQQQRVAIARALAIQPKILLFDEPTSGLDPEISEVVLSVMKELLSTGVTMLVVTHTMQLACNLADRIIFLDEGKIVGNSTPEEFFNAPSHPRIQQFLGKSQNKLS